jgi:hypothetical protein
MHKFWFLGLQNNQPLLCSNYKEYQLRLPYTLEF